MARWVDQLTRRCRRALRRRRAARPSPRFTPVEPLEDRVLLAAFTLGEDGRSFLFSDGDNDRILVRLSGPGTAAITLDGDAANFADIDNIRFEGATDRTSLHVRVQRKVAPLFGQTTIGSITSDGSLRNLNLRRVVIDGDGIDIAGSLRLLTADGFVEGADLTLGSDTPDGPNDGPALRANVATFQGAEDNPVEITTPFDIVHMRVQSDAVGVRADIGGDLRTLFLPRFRGVPSSMSDARFTVDGKVNRASIAGFMTDGSALAAGEGIGVFDLRRSLTDSHVLSGATLGPAFDLVGAAFGVAEMRLARVGGDVIDSIIAAGGDPNLITADDVFEDGEVLEGGEIRSLLIKGQVVGTAASEHVNPGIYAASIRFGRVGNERFRGKPADGVGTVGSAVIDPLPSVANALTADDVEEVIERAVSRAQQLGVAATISVVDREGNLLSVVRMDGGLETVDISAGGTGGLEQVDGVVSTSLIAATKAGTGAFLSTSRGNAFTTRTAGHIIQTHFPPGVRFQDGGPLFGVQLSSLPTSDVNRLPLGLSADPGGLPLYRGGELIGGVGVEVDGIYTVDSTRIDGSATVEEKIALAGQATLTPPANIRADKIFIDGIRLDYANGAPPSVASLGAVTPFDDLVAGGEIDVLVAPQVSPASKFTLTTLGSGSGSILGEVPDNALQDFYDNVTDDFAFLAGNLNDGVQLTADDVESILLDAHLLNGRLRAQIRRDVPQISHVTVSVVDQNGNLLGAFRTGDAPVFGYDVSVQKARTAAFFSRTDAGDELRALDGDGGDVASEVDVDAIDALALGIFALVGDSPFTNHVDRAAALGVLLDGAVAVADRTGGFLSRPNLPDGLDGAPPGPFSVNQTRDFSPFNTGLQTSLIIPQLVEFLLAFNTITGATGEADALQAFIDGTIGGGGVVPLDSNAADPTTAGVPNLNPGGGLPGNSLANGMQIFAGSVPLYKDGQLVGGVGVSGDGIEQDDFIALAGALDFQEFGPGVQRADDVQIAGNIRLPYVKIPRAPFEGT